MKKLLIIPAIFLIGCDYPTIVSEGEGVSSVESVNCGDEIRYNIKTDNYLTTEENLRTLVELIESTIEKTNAKMSEVEQ